MGIPSYFVHIVKSYPHIIKQYYKDCINIHNLYIDSNSIIYDAIRNTPYDKNDTLYENKIYKWICERLIYYIKTIEPTNRVLIAFDGVAPVAKLEQQRNRRYKTWYVNDYLNQFAQDKKEMWDTTAITPGSEFMKNLSNYINNYFTDKYTHLKIIISSSKEIGEGEHKIYDYIRSNTEYHYDTNTVIYGLDADLIMLSLIHLKVCINLYLFRETPHFIGSINSKLKPNELYMLDIYELNEKLIESISDKVDEDITKDYIFLCFLLGNDFMPHFPALNIRTNGIDYILNFYKKNNLRIIKNNKIIWKNFKKLIQDLSEHEEQFAMKEHATRNKMQKALSNKFKNIETEDALMSIPILDRKVENYINIGDHGWQERYYKELFDIEITDERRKQISINYLEGLEWNYKYYTENCIDWRWHYKYKYPPLLQDLYKYIPQFDTTFIEPNNNKAVDPMVQLAYVLPRNSLDLLPEKIYKNLIRLKPNWYRLDFKLIWAYCRYLWEGHVDLPIINLNELTEIVNI